MPTGKPKPKDPHSSAISQATRAELGYRDDAFVSALLGIDLATLRNRRSLGNAPKSSKVGRVHLTTDKDLHAFIARKARRASA